MKNVLRAIRKFLSEADMVLFALSLVASLLGLALVASATASFSSNRYVVVQAAAIGIGIAVFVLFTLLDPSDLAAFWKTLLVFNVLFVFSTFFFGVDVKGNKSWLLLPYINITMQPAEIVKLSFILLLAKQMHTFRDYISSPKSVLLLFLHLALMVGLIWVASSDMGMSLVYVFIFICMCFAAGIKFWWFLGGAAAVGVATPLIWNSLAEYQRMRVLVVIDPALDPLGTGWQAARSRLALGSGQLFGSGLFSGTQTQKGLLPEKQADFIYAVAGEELGMIGCTLIMLLLCAIIIRCLYVAYKAKDGMCALVCVGIAGMLIFQTFSNIGMCVGLTPIIGITLPFISSGGSSVITMFAAMGIVSAVKMRPKPEWLKRRT